MYKELYFSLFNAVTDAIEELDARNYGKARMLLVRGQVDAEEQYMDAAEEMTNREIWNNEPSYLALLIEMSERMRHIQTLLENGKYAEAGRSAERILKQFDSRELIVDTLED